MTDNKDMDKRADAIADDDLDKVTGGVVNAGFSAGGGSIPSLGGLRLDPVNTRKDMEELNKGNTPPNPFPQNCG